MKLKQIIDVLNAEVIQNKHDGDIDVDMACGSDLMSDVLSFAKPGAILFTGLTTAQVIYTAELADIKIVCFVRGKNLPEETTRLAQTKDVVLLRTNLPMFESCGKIYGCGLRGCSEHED